tara:strand:+ start:14113 stop:14607 length:495 start_codon:yes stop_codon:yes gene_type:complete
MNPLVLAGAGYVVWMVYYESRVREEAWKIARDMKRKYGKPILNAGTDNRFFNIKWARGDVNCDILPRTGVQNFTLCNINRLSQFGTKEFSCVVASHILEHKGVDPAKALAEMRRVANSVVVVAPSRYHVPAWLVPSHDRSFAKTLYVFEDGRPAPDMVWSAFER